MAHATDSSSSAVEEAREKAASVAHEAAQMLHDHPPGRGRAAEATEHLAGRIDQTSGYLRESDVRTLRADVRQYIRKHPMQVIAAGVISGLFFSRILSH
ncbi:MAG: hypothetical protein HY873_06925 [Chloroflexi bacterium]|nr:hypothetical protein [Chloroflexota bacterium]